ncbi:sodium:alanine symporter family protein [Endozoicomonas sp. Mp262]|uniref:alanine/glycine:cation symporter family protein n=1 Tax=Endozoicomonas sp. Mp262 TaxID=2919499 RepID=UPI0021DA427B
MVTEVNNLLWGYLLIFLLAGTGIYFTVRLRFVQVRRFKQSVWLAFGGKKGGKADGKGMSSFQSLTTAIAAQVGTGNLAGAATAIAAGGPGAIFWMWITAFFGMGTIFAEAVLAQEYKENINGQVRGGPAFYLSKGVGSKGLAVFFAVSIIIALGFIGNMVQANSIGHAFDTAFGVNPLVIGIVLSCLAGLIFRGGVRSIASFTSKVVPFMALLYIAGSLWILLTNLSAIGAGLKMIVVGAFDPMAATGGVLGVTIKEAVRYGVARGLFSNEAGMGSTPHAHAVAKVKHPVEQGTIAMFGVFFDTFIILTITALVILTIPVDGSLTGIALTQGAFHASMGPFGDIFIAIALLFFAFSTIIGWYFFGEANIRYLFRNEHAVVVYEWAVMACIIVGCALKVDLVWELADMFNGLMVLPNLIGLLLLAKVVSKRLDEFERLDQNVGRGNKQKIITH